MVNVIGVRFENAGKLYFFTPGALWPTPGDFVIVETTVSYTHLTLPTKRIV